MPKGYIIGHITVNDPEAYKAYIAQDTPILQANGTHFLVRGGASEVVEGTSEDRHILFAYDSYDAARAAFLDPDYQKVADIRRSAATSTILVVEGQEGFDPAPPGDTPRGYIIAHVEVRDAEGYQPYVARNGEIFARHGGRYIVRGGASEVLEGTSLSRHVVIEFPSLAAARAGYDDPDYVENRKIRQAHADSVIILVEGVAP